MFVTALFLMSAIAVSEPQPATAAKPAASAAKQAKPMVTEADRPQIREILARLNAAETEILRDFDRHEMTKEELARLRDLTTRLTRCGSNNPCNSGEKCCSNGTCISENEQCPYYPPHK
jgi:hypothetical protein